MARKEAPGHRFLAAAAALMLAAVAALLLEGCGKEESIGPGVVAEPPADRPRKETESTTPAPTETTRPPRPTLPPSGTLVPPQERLGSFLVIGDWGWDPEVHGDITNVTCQATIAQEMGRYTDLLGDVKFVINVGDSFYPNGVENKSDPQWESKWRDIYPDQVRAVPWYSVYGNHDYINDPCVCSESLEDCAQINDDPTDLDYFFMPNYSYTVKHPELDVEVIALDMNYYTWVNYTCHYTACKEQCEVNLKKRMDAAFDLFYERTANSEASNLLVFSHYPTDYFWGFPDFLSELSNDTNHHIEYFGGHRHNVDQRSCTSTKPNNNWLVGGGGGWGCEGYGDEQGFLVGEIGADGSVTTYPVLIDFEICCERPERRLDPEL